MLKFLPALAAALLLVAAPAASAAERTRPRTISVDVAVSKFGVRHGKPVAFATARTLAYTRQGYARTSQQRTTLAVSTASSGCKILTLHLNDLKLVLLGLTVDTSAVNLNITGRTNGALGKLFCRLASGLKLKSTARVARATTALNHRLRAHRLHTLRFRAVIAQQTRQASQPVCPVLDLTLGPLNLDLLGLYVDLYGPTANAPVTVTITADPNGGVLGSLFCKLATQQA